MGLEIPESKDIKQLIEVEKARLEIEEFIASMLGAKPAAFFNSITSEGITIKGEITDMELREGQFSDISVALLTKAGNPAKYQAGTESFVSSDPAASVGPDPNDPTNALKARVTGVNGANNTALVVTFTADGDPDDDNVRPIVATLDVVVTQGEAFVASITAGPATDLP